MWRRDGDDLPLLFDQRGCRETEEKPQTVGFSVYLRKRKSMVHVKVCAAALSCRSSALTGVCLPSQTRRDPEDGGGSGGGSGGVGVVFLCRDVVLLCFVFEKIKL